MKRNMRIIGFIVLFAGLISAAAWLACALMSYPDSRREAAPGGAGLLSGTVPPSGAAPGGEESPGRGDLGNPVPAVFRFTRVSAVSADENPLSGVNLGVALTGLNGGNWGLEPDQGDFDALRDAGFRYIRVPVQFLPCLREGDGGYRLDDSMLERLDRVLNGVLDRGMTAILDFHCLLAEDVYAFADRREKLDNEERFLAVWGLLSARYRDWPAELYFELANEPRKPIMPKDWNRYVSGALDLIRASGGNNRTRYVVVANPILIDPVFRSWENVRGIKRLELPSAADDPNILVTFHYYDPVPFTYQGQTYNKSLKRYSRFWDGNLWTDTERQKALVRRDFDRVARWAAENRRQVILGEFGVSVFADAASQIRWTRLVREEAESRGMIWLFWQFFYEYDGDTLGGLWSHSGGFWRSEMVDALQTRERRMDVSARGLGRAESPAARPPLPEDRRKVLDRALAELRDPEWKAREAAARSLADGGRLTPAAVSALARALSGDVEWHVRREAARALYACRPDPALEPIVLSALTAALGDEEWQVRLEAVRAMGRMGTAAESALPVLCAFLDDEEWQLREAALLAMAFISPGDPAVREAVRNALTDPEDHIRGTARTLSAHPDFR